MRGRVAFAALAASAACIAGALAGRWIPALDTLAVVLPAACGIALATSILARGLAPAARLAGILVAGLGAVPVAAALWPESEVVRARPGPVLRLLQHNLAVTNGAPDLLARLETIDVATLQEVGDAGPVLAGIPARWRFVRCTREGPGLVAVVARYPRRGGGCLSDRGAWMRIAAPGGDVTVVSLHLAWPWPAKGDRQARQVAALVHEIAALPPPVIVAGDFNQMPWAAAAGRIADAAGGRVAGGLRGSYPLPGGMLAAPIDHVIVPVGWRVAARLEGPHGSDHRAIRADLVRPAIR